MPGILRESARRKFHTLDGMRGMAALAVVTHHAGWMFGHAYMQHAYMAVDLFFVLSGFVLSNAYERRFSAGLGAWRFFVMRLVRLYPLYILGILIAAGWVTWNLLQGVPVRLSQADPWTWGQLRTALANSIFFLPSAQLGAGPPARYPLNMPAWSLLFELLINLAFALVALRLTSIVLGLIVLVSGAMLAWVGLTHGSLNAGWTTQHLDVAVVRVIFGFFVGVLIHRMAGKMPAWLKIPPAVILTVMVAAFVWTPSGQTLALFDVACALMLFPMLVLLGSNVEPGRWTRPAYSFGGLTSYAVYATHFPLCFAATVWFAQAGYDSGGNAPWSGAVFLIGMLALAWFLDRFYDAPVRAWLTRRIFPAARTDRASDIPAGAPVKAHRASRAPVPTD